MSPLPADLLFSPPLQWGAWRRIGSSRRTLLFDWDSAIRLLSKALQAASPDREQAAVVAAADLSDIRQTLEGSSDAYGRLVNKYQQEIASQVWKYAPRPEVIE